MGGGNGRGQEPPYRRGQPASLILFDGRVIPGKTPSVAIYSQAVPQHAACRMPGGDYSLIVVLPLRTPQGHVEHDKCTVDPHWFVEHGHSQHSLRQGWTED